MEVQPETAEELDLAPLDAQEAQFFTCHVCGDNWLSIREVLAGNCTITFVHQMGMRPLLKRVAYMTTPVVMNEGTVEHWAYYLGDDAVEEDDWRQRLAKRRDVLRAVCSN
jgi:hypothetical protein